MKCAAIAFILVAQLAGAADMYTGSQSCAKCHPSQSKSQARTGHANALHRTSLHPLASRFVPAHTLTRPPNFRFQFSAANGGVKVRFGDGSDVAEAVLEWAFGAGAQAVTFVSLADRDHYVEHYWSYYSSIKTMGPTPGHQALKPKSLGEAAGLYYKTADQRSGILGCFECHSTGGVQVQPSGEVEPAEPGVHCEACHGSGSAHVSSRGKQPVRNPARMTAASLNDFCGRCHRPPASDPASIDWNYAWNVRHQPVYFSRSRCFTESKGALSCLTCHSPHEPMQIGNAAHYDSRCSACHTAVSQPPSRACRSGCTSCHMPQVSTEPPLRFTNHWIGVYGDGAKLSPNAR